MSDEHSALRCDNSDDSLTPGQSPGVLASGPSASLHLQSFAGPPEMNPQGGDGPVLFLTELPLNVMPYLNLDPDFFGHPKCIKLVSLLGERAEIYPMRLWCHAAKYHPKDGNFSGYSEKDLARIAGWDGEPSALLEPLTATGFLDKTRTGYLVHDWPDHEGHLEMLKERARKGAKARWGRLNTRRPKEMLKHSPSKTPPGKERIGKERKGSIVVSTGTNTKNTTHSEQPHQTLINRFLELKGTSRATLTPAQVSGAYKRHSRSALALIAEAGGLDHALVALDCAGSHFDRKSLTWTLDTIAKHLPNLGHYAEELPRARHGFTANQLVQFRQLATWLARVPEPSPPGKVSGVDGAGVSHVQPGP